jgi:hypothetical protein
MTVYVASTMLPSWCLTVAICLHAQVLKHHVVSLVQGTWQCSSFACAGLKSSTLISIHRFDSIMESDLQFIAVVSVLIQVV